MLLIVIALLVSFPIAWYMMNKWLPIIISYYGKIVVFALAGINALANALITVGSRAIRAAQITR